MPTARPTKNQSASTARGGGQATAAGVEFQTQVAALLASDLISERQLDARLRLGSARAALLRLETEAPIDDILVRTDAGGFVFIQAKTSVNLSSDAESPLGKVAGQFVRQWLSSQSGDGKRGWDRPLDRSKDRFVLATGAGSSDAVTRDLAAALASVHAAASAPLPQDQERALARFKDLLAAAWKSIDGREPDATELNSLVELTTVVQLDFGGPDRAVVDASLRDILEDANATGAAFAVLVQDCQRLMAARLGSDALGFRTTLASNGIRLRAAPSYRADVEALRAYSDRTRRHLEEYEETRVGGTEIRIDRQCTVAVMASAAEASLLLVGEPGAGKSAVVSSAAARLKIQGNEVLELAVDRLPVETLDGLRAELDLTHSVYEVLRNWPGHGPAYLFIDALDATRGGASEKVFRTLIADVVALPDRRWRVVASIRSFDLRLGEEFRRLFQGAPPSSDYVDTSFPDVRHLLIPPWTEHELADLLQRAPALETAITSGGGRLRQLALVPFNTRLLADLISTGIKPEDFGGVGSQVQLLALYWRHRVSKHGAGAELCLAAAVGQMIAARALRAERLVSAKPDPRAFDELMRENVLVPVSGDRFVSFRHHILFDYAASRVYLDPSNLEAMTDILKRDKGLGLLLGPALVFALQELWSARTAGHSAFWDAVIAFTGNADCDPVARSVAARTAAELPAQRGDFAGLVAAPGRASANQNVSAAISSIVGALSVRAEDKQSLSLDPWCELAAGLSRHVGQVVWSLRALLFLTVERAQTSEQRAELGVASRSLFKHAIDNPSLAHLMSSAVGFVADTYASDATASRELLRMIFIPEHFERYAHAEVPWLARKLEPIAAVDPAFVAEIYGKSFAAEITDTSTTSLGASQILPLSSNRRQDYQQAQWQLKEYFATFLAEHPGDAVTALMDVMAGYVAREHPPSEGMQTWTFNVNGKEDVLVEDWSRIWAWNPGDEHGDNELLILKAFVKRLQTAAPDDATHLAKAVAERSKSGVMWSRLFLAGASRPDVLGAVLWPYATKRPFIASRDTRKDAIDFISARYPLETAASRQAFEEEVLGISFPRSSEPEATRKDTLEVLFGTIGHDQLATEEARRFAEAARSKGGVVNERPANFTVTSGSPDDWWWLRKDGVELKTPANTNLLAAIKTAKSDLQLEQGAGQRSYDAQTGASHLEILKQGIESATRDGADSSVIDYASGVLAEGAEKVAGLDVAQLRGQPAVVSMLIELIEKLATHANPEVGEDTEKNFENSASWASPATRIEAAEAAMLLSRLDTATFDRLRPLIERLLTSDPHPAVRLSIAQRLTALWETARSAMWDLASRVAERENNRGVISFFANYFLGRIVHHAPEEVERLTLRLAERFGERNDNPAENIREQIGGILALLWVSHGRSAARETLQSWLSDPAPREAELGHVFFGIREALVLGYDTADPRDVAIRKRAQELAGWAVEATASKLEEYLARYKPGVPIDEGEKKRGTLAAKLLNDMSDQFYFASGAFRHPPDKKGGLDTLKQKQAFLTDVAGTLKRIGDVGTPGTVHHLVELLDFLMPADPALVFDLTAHTLLGTGRAHGYQFESLGVDRVVALVGRFLADHRDLFADEERRRKLIACLDVFMEAGWPSARRLLYRLPELLQ